MSRREHEISKLASLINNTILSYMVKNGGNTAYVEDAIDQVKQRWESHEGR